MVEAYARMASKAYFGNFSPICVRKVELPGFGCLPPGRSQQWSIVTTVRDTRLMKPIATFGTAGVSGASRRP